MTTTDAVVHDVRSAVQVERLTGHLERFARLSEPGDGVTRLAYSPLEREAHAVFAEYMSGLGLAVRTDAAGNTVAESPGALPGVPAIGTGSHLDSVPFGGRFDGIVGVVAAMEVAQVVHELGLYRRLPWRFVAFAAEEGARFGQACNGSRMAAGLTTSADLHGIHDADGVTLAAAMAAVGLEPDGVDQDRWKPQEWLAFLELHIEQGQVLEHHGASVGVVDAISGSTRLEVVVTGQASHTGGTPMSLRRDALAAAAECALAVERLVSDWAHHGTRATVGRLDVSPGSITTIPGRVVFTVDVRDVDGARQRETAASLLDQFSQIAERRGVAISAEVIGDTSPVILPSWLVGHTVEAAEGLDVSPRVLASGASHDTQQVNHVTAGGMIFVPSRDGVSHAPAEWTSPQDVALGTQVLLAAMLRLDETGASLEEE